MQGAGPVTGAAAASAVASPPASAATAVAHPLSATVLSQRDCSLPSRRCFKNASRCRCCKHQEKQGTVHVCGTQPDYRTAFTRTCIKACTADSGIRTDGRQAGTLSREFRRSAAAGLLCRISVRGRSDPHLHPCGHQQHASLPAQVQGRQCRQGHGRPAQRGVHMHDEQHRGQPQREQRAHGALRGGRGREQKEPRGGQLMILVVRVGYAANGDG